MGTKYTRPTRTRNGKTAKVTSDEMKRTIAKALGIKREDVDKKYYIFRNKLRAYESFKKASGADVKPQSPLNLMYAQAKSMLRYGTSYKPSQQMKDIQSFSAVSITKGRELASAKGTYFHKHDREIGERAISNFAKFIDAHSKYLSGYVDKFRSGEMNSTDLINTLSAYADLAKEAMKDMGDEAEEGDVPLGETYGSSDIDFSEIIANLSY